MELLCGDITEDQRRDLRTLVTTAHQGSGLFQLVSKPLVSLGFRGFLRAIERLLHNNPSEDGFPVAAFLCLANMAGMVLVIDCHFLETFPEPLREMLMNPQVIKVAGYWAKMAKSVIQLGSPSGPQGVSTIVPVDVTNVIEFFMGPSVKREVAQLLDHWPLVLNTPSPGLLPLTTHHEPDLLIQCMGRTVVWTLDVLLMGQVNRRAGERLPSELYHLPTLFHRLVATLGTQVQELPSPGFQYRLQDLQSEDSDQPIMRPLALRITLHQVLNSFHRDAPFLGKPYIHNNLRVSDARQPTFKTIRIMLENQVTERDDWFVSLRGEELALVLLQGRVKEAPGLAQNIDISIAPIGGTGHFNLYDEAKCFLRSQRSLADPGRHSLIRLNRQLDPNTGDLLYQNECTIRAMQRVRKAPYIIWVDNTGTPFITLLDNKEWRVYLAKLWLPICRMLWMLIKWRFPIPREDLIRSPPYSCAPVYNH